MIAIGTWLFSAFLAVSVIVYWAVAPRFRPWVLLAFSLVFYAAAFPPYSLVLLFLAALGLTAGRVVAASRRKKLWLGVSIAGVVAVLAGFKYSGMAVLTWNGLLGGVVPQLPVPQIVAPLGISYVTFGIVHYLVEVYRGAPVPSARDFLLYLAFFPTVTSGPIKRYTPFLEDMERKERISGTEASQAVARIVVGLAKKLIIADTLAPLAGRLATPGTWGSVVLLLSVYAFTLRIYFDFSGYSDIAIGSAQLFGFRIIENFSGPYLKRNLAEFWRSWHMSLTRLLTEYVYFPLGGSREGEWKRARNTLVAFAVSGLWHGAAWHFVVWGLWHGLGLVVHRQWVRLVRFARGRLDWVEGLASSGVGRVAGYGLGWALTFNFVALGWVLFAVPLPTALQVYSKLLALAGAVVGKVLP